MHGVRPTSRWLRSGPPTGRGCRLAIVRFGSAHYGSRQFSARASLRKHEGETQFNKAGLDEKRQNIPSGGAGGFREPASYPPSRIVLFSLFPFVRVRSTLQTTQPGGGLQRGAAWTYRILWLLGVGYAGSIYLSPSPSPSSDHPVFAPPRFTRFSIIEKHDVSPTSVVLTTRPQTAGNADIEPYEEDWMKGTWSVEFKQPQLQIARSYTPLPPTPDTLNPYDLRFLIRREKGGEVSNYLANLPPDAPVEIRGPHAGVDLPMNTTDVVFLAGGTGIAPAMQVVHTLLEKRAEVPKPKIHIVWANRKRADCVGGVSSSKARKYDLSKAAGQPSGAVVRELQRMRQKYPDNLSIDYLVDEEGTFMDRKTISAITEQTLPATTGAKLLFVSGPEGFVSFLAGPKRWEGGEEKQGRVGGVLGQMGLTGWQVWKM